MFPREPMASKMLILYWVLGLYAAKTAQSALFCVKTYRKAVDFRVHLIFSSFGLS